MVAVRHAGQCRHRLALAAGADEDDLVVAQVVELLDVDEDAGGHVQVAELGGDAHVPDHRPADHGHLAPRLVRGVEHLLHAVHVGGEAGDDDPALGVPEHLVDGRGDVALRGREAGHLGVGGVGEEEVDALLPQPGERPQVGEPAVEGQLVHLEVAGVQQRPSRGAHRDGERIGDGVVHGDELAVEVAEPLAVPLTHPEGVGPDAVLPELRLDEGQSQL